MKERLEKIAKTIDIVKGLVYTEPYEVSDILSDIVAELADIIADIPEVQPADDEYDDYEEYEDEYEDYASNMPCDTFGMCDHTCKRLLTGECDGR